MISAPDTAQDPGRVLLIVPPFYLLDRGSLGVHLLQALGRQTGFQVDVLYANALFARSFGGRA